MLQLLITGSDIHFIFQMKEKWHYFLRSWDIYLSNNKLMLYHPKNLPYLIFALSFSFVDPYLMGALKVLILVKALDQGDETFHP